MAEYIGIDIGGTNIRIGAINKDVYQRKRNENKQ